MDSQLLGRALGTAGPETLQRAVLSRQLHAIQAAPEVGFDGQETRSRDHEDLQDEVDESTGHGKRAHQAGVNCIAIDRFEGR